MRQIALPLGNGPGAGRVVIGNANSAVVEAFGAVAGWPFRTAVLLGPPRSGKSLLARWFVENGLGEAVDDADQSDDVTGFSDINVFTVSPLEPRAGKQYAAAAHRPVA